MDAPEFWTGNDPWSRLAAAALAPLGMLYGTTVAWKAHTAKPHRANVPILCVGNLTAGGTGKTPVAIAIAKALLARGRNPCFLSRGYGGEAEGPLLVTPERDASEVGDEPLLLAGTAPVVVSRDRGKGAKLAVERGADVIVMDDGHQNFSLAKDLSVVVVDGETGFGNGRILPAGPLREPVRQGLKRADAVIVMGDGSPSLEGFSGPVLRARIAPADAAGWLGRRVVAFAGIGRPEKFFRSLRDLGVELAATAGFADHHRYTLIEIADLRARAHALGAELVTTEKDHARLAQAERQDIAVLPVLAEFAEPEALGRLLDRLPGAR